MQRSGNVQVDYKKILKFCVGLLICMRENHELPAESWLFVLHFLAFSCTIPRGLRLLPDAQVVAEHFDFLQFAALQELRDLKSQVLQDFVKKTDARAVLSLRRNLAAKLCPNAEGFSWTLWCYRSLSPSNFVSSLQQDVLTPIHIVFSDVLSPAAIVKVSHEMDQICEEFEQRSEHTFFSSIANAQRCRKEPKPSSQPVWLKKNHRSLEHYLSKESDYRRIREGSVGFLQCPTNVPAPMHFMFALASSMMMQSFALAYMYGLMIMT